MEIKALQKRLNLTLSAQKHCEFKAVCAIKGLQMTDVLYKFVETYLTSKRDQLDRLMELYQNKGSDE